MPAAPITSQGHASKPNEKRISLEPAILTSSYITGSSQPAALLADENSQNNIASREVQPTPRLLHLRATNVSPLSPLLTRTIRYYYLNFYFLTSCINFHKWTLCIAPLIGSNSRRKLRLSVRS